jgi:EmrB/QacA subfamily drug resistance transporter
VGDGVSLLVARILQSFGGALLIANGTAIVTDAFPKRELGMALGVNSMVIAVGAAIAPLLGGLLTEKLGWRAVFYVNVPIGVIGTIWAALQIRDKAELAKGQRFDLAGSLLFCAGLFLLLLGLSFGGMSGWLDPAILVELCLGAALLACFVIVERRAEQPLFDLELFRSRLLSFAFLSTFLNGVARGALTFLLIFYLQGIRAMDPLTAGIYLVPFALAMMVASPLSGALADKHGSRFLSTLGLAVSAVGLMGFLWLRADTSLAEVVLWQAIMGFGSGLFNSPNTNTIMGAVPADRRGIAAGTRMMMNNAGSVVSIAMTFAVISSGISSEAMSALFAGTQVGSQGITVDVFMGDLRLAFLICFAISVIASFISFLRGPEPKWGKEDGAAAK